MAGRRGGARPGAGAPRGPQKKTIERAIIAEQIVERASMSGKKLAKEVLDDFMHLFAGMAAAYQPLPPGMVAPPGKAVDETKFLTYAKLAIDTAAELGPYQSPRLKAIAVHVAPTAPIDKPGENAMLSELTGQQAYRLLRDTDVIDMESSPVATAAKAKRASRG
jgi:hypothetical protein